MRRLLALLLAGIAPAPAVAAEVPAATQAKAAPLAVATRLARWQLDRMGRADHLAKAGAETRDPRSWQQAAFWAGMTALADAGGPPDIRAAILAMGRANDWQPGARPYHADDLAIGWAYVWAGAHGAGPPATAPIRARFDRILAEPARVSLAFYQPATGAIECQRRWCWSDALFMAPPVMAALTRATGDTRYRDFALREMRATTDFLYDPAERLFFRDSRFFERRDDAGRKQFWSRGNGWVVAGLARLIPLLPAGSADRQWAERLFVDMPGRLKELQKPDGYWAPSLLAAPGSPPETSGTAFFTYGLAWGINAGLLDRATFEPVVRKGWSALVRSIQPDGRLGWVQQVSDRPDRVEAGDTQYYGVGGLLLAATQVAVLDRSGAR